MANNLLQLKAGSSAGLDNLEVEPGSIVYTTDTRKLYINLDGDTDHVEVNANVANSVANDLAVTVDGAAFKTFDGSAATTINLKGGTNVTLAKSGNDITITAKDTTYTALKNPTALVWGSKSYDGSEAKEITLADFGLTNAMHFVGTTTTALTDGTTTAAVTISGKSHSPTSGDIVLYSGKEFIWTGSAWELLGDEGSYALKTYQVVAGTNLAGGGALNGNVTLSHATITTTAPTTGVYVKSIVTDGYGHVTGWTSGDCYNLICQINGTTQVTYDPFADTANKTFNVPVMTAATTSAAGAIGLVPAPAKMVSGTVKLLAESGWQALTAGTGISISNLTITNSGVRTITKKSSNVLTVNTNGTSADITVVNAATTSAAGIVKIGSNITVSSGVISISKTNIENALGAASASQNGYLTSTDFTNFTNAYKAVTWGSF